MISLPFRTSQLESVYYATKTINNLIKFNDFARLIVIKLSVGEGLNEPFVTEIAPERTHVMCTKSQLCMTNDSRLDV